MVVELKMCRAGWQARKSGKSCCCSLKTEFLIPGNFKFTLKTFTWWAGKMKTMAWWWWWDNDGDGDDMILMGWWSVHACFHCIQLFVTLWTVAHQAPLSMRFSRQEYWSGLPCPPPGYLPNTGIKPKSPAVLQVGSLPLAPPGKPDVVCRYM